MLHYISSDITVGRVQCFQPAKSGKKNPVGFSVNFASFFISIEKQSRSRTSLGVASLDLLNGFSNLQKIPLFPTIQILE